MVEKIQKLEMVEKIDLRMDGWMDGETSLFQLVCAKLRPMRLS